MLGGSSARDLGLFPARIVAAGDSERDFGYFPASRCISSRKNSAFRDIFRCMSNFVLAGGGVFRMFFSAETFPPGIEVPARTFSTSGEISSSKRMFCRDKPPAPEKCHRLAQKKSQPHLGSCDYVFIPRQDNCHSFVIILCVRRTLSKVLEYTQLRHRRVSGLGSICI